MPLSIISDPDECSTYVHNKLTQRDPCFLARIGGSDTDALAALAEIEISKHSPLINKINDYKALVERYNGFYTKNDDSLKDFESYLNVLRNAYEAADSVFIVCQELNHLYFPHLIDKCTASPESLEQYENLMKFVTSGDKETVALPYNYVERMNYGGKSLFGDFSVLLDDRKVLAISPFSESIQSTFLRNKRFFKNYNYPDLHLATYETPITYSGLPAEFYPDQSWHDTLERMKNEVSNIEFDIALLSCGSYAMPLGVYIRDVLKRKAIYLGGIMQMYFGIMGRRYETPFFVNQINREVFIKPLEGDRFLSHVPLTEGQPTEAFGAYF
ncbi:hypothetical protein C8J32_11431 [Rhizobium sp. PP-CC-3A-592]|nr:hypothetical protein C8J32_11431 [Rhizobium sp. PP-CC-3A-592]